MTDSKEDGLRAVEAILLRRFNGKGIDGYSKDAAREMVGAVIEAMSAPVAESKDGLRARNVASDNLGRWLSAALEDPQVCQEMKADINAWFRVGEPAPSAFAEIITTIERHQYAFERAPAAWNAFVALRKEIVEMAAAASSPPVGGSGEVVAWRSVVSDPPVAVSVLARFFDNELGEWVYTTFDPGPVSLTMAGPYSEWLPLDTFNRPLAAPVPNGVPEGWKLVPIEPPEAMVQAGMARLGWLISPTPPEYEYGNLINPGLSEEEAAEIEGQLRTEFGEVYSELLAASPVTPEGLSGGDGWQDISTAPRDGTPILGWCVHEADPYRESETTLTIYGAHCEGLSRVEDGPNIIQWGGGSWESTDEYGSGYQIADWWFRVGSEFEDAANPICWKPITAPNTV